VVAPAPSATPTLLASYVSLAKALLKLLTPSQLFQFFASSCLSPFPAPTFQYLAGAGSKLSAPSLRLPPPLPCGLAILSCRRSRSATPYAGETSTPPGTRAPPLPLHARAKWRGPKLSYKLFVLGSGSITSVSVFFYLAKKYGWTCVHSSTLTVDSGPAL
jgi:hypothetical protein